MLDKIKALLEVQEIDLKVMSLSQEKDALPLKLERFNEEVKNEEHKKKLLDEENQTLIKKRREKERELEEKNDTRKKFQEQLYRLKSNKEYTALLREIENVKSEIEKLEEDILILMERIEEKEEASARQNKAFEAKRRELETVTEENLQKLAEIHETLERYSKEREDKAYLIPGEILISYEKVRQGRNGVGLVSIRNNACQGCFMELPPQVINETKLGQRLVTCENCNRLLYLES